MLDKPTFTILRSRKTLIASGFFLVLLLGYIFWTVKIKTVYPPAGNMQNPAPPLLAKEAAQVGEIEILNRTAEKGLDYPIISEATLQVSITPPTQMTEMQLGFDPSFSATEWRAIESTVAIESHNYGYQTLFVRFRENENSSPTETIVAGVDINPEFEAASSVTANQKPPVWVRPMSEKVLLVKVQNGHLLWQAQQPYDFSDGADGDSISRNWGLRGKKLKTVTRNEKPYGEQVFGSESLLRPYDTIDGEVGLDLSQAERAWTIKSANGTITNTEVRPLVQAAGSGRDQQGRLVPTTTFFALILDQPLQATVEYSITAPFDQIATATYTYTANQTVSPAIQVNQAGYASGDPKKVAYLGGWHEELPGLGYEELKNFTLVDEDGSTTYKGHIKEQKVDSTFHPELELTGSPVYALNFSEVTQKGRYKICIETIGCSIAFAIEENPWAALTVSVARSAYHQRSGVALGPPYTSISRPRPYHPEDGSVVHPAEFSLLEANHTPFPELFTNLVESAAKGSVEDAWGGHHDAGDWDRRIQHLWYARSAADLATAYPEFYENLHLNIPESANAIPDILDEGLWSLDFYRRMQKPNGAISGGIEASEHPMPNTSSWTDSLKLYQYSPDAWSTYLYAGVAAEYAKALLPYDPKLAEEYRLSALQAMQWAEGQELPTSTEEADAVAAQRIVAAAAMYYLTGESEWEDLFIDLTSFESQTTQYLECHRHELCDAAWIYLKSAKQNSKVKTNIEKSFSQNAQELTNVVEGTSYAWGVEHPGVPLIWGLGAGGAPKTLGLLRAYEISGDDALLEAALQTAAFSLGANPNNTSFLTGVGKNPVRYPLILDSENGGLPVWPGTPVFGNHQLDTASGDTWVNEFLLGPVDITDPNELPYLWQWQDAKVPFFNEFTLHQSHSPALQTFGTLAALAELNQTPENAE